MQVLYEGRNSSRQSRETSQAPARGTVTVKSIVCLLEDGLDLALSLGDAEATVEALMGMAAVQGLAADRLEVTAAVAAELRKLEK
jgi:hypothetical protein